MASSWSSGGWRQFFGHLSIQNIGDVDSNLLIRVAYREVPFATLFYVSNPVTVALSRRRLQALLLALVILQIVTIAKEKSINIKSKRFMFTPLEIRGQESAYSERVSSDLSKNRIQVSSASFGLMYQGTPIKFSHNLTFSGDGRVFLDFHDAVDWDGWFLITSQKEPPEFDPVRFALYAYDASNWTLVGSSTYFCLHADTLFLHGHFDTPLQRGAVVVFDLARLRFGMLTIIAFNLFVMASAGFFRYEHICVVIMRLHYPLIMLTFLTRAAFWAAAQQWYGCIVYLHLALVRLVMFHLTLHDAFSKCFLAYGLHTLVAAAFIFRLAGLGATSRHLLVEGLIFVGLGGGVLMSAWFTHRWSRRVLQRHRVAYDAAWCQLLVTAAPDLVALDVTTCRLLQPAVAAATGEVGEIPRQSLASWQGSEAGVINAPSIRRMCGDFTILYNQAAVAKGIFRSKVWAYAIRSRGSFPAVGASRRRQVKQPAQTVSSANRPPTQDNRMGFTRTVSDGATLLPHCETESKDSLGASLASVGKLQRQGTSMRRIRSTEFTNDSPYPEPQPPESPSADGGRQNGLKESATVRRGSALAMMMGSWRRLSWLMPWEPTELGRKYVRAGEVGMRRVRWAGLKGVKRTVEKAVRCYRGDAARICDLVRQAIIFDEVSDLIACLQVIAEDPDVSFVRIKNRYHLDYDAGESAGYRDVNLSLRLDGEDARASGAAGHICELQLVLKPFYKLRRGAPRIRGLSQRSGSMMRTRARFSFST